MVAIDTAVAPLASQLRVSVMRLSRRLRSERTEPLVPTAQLSALFTLSRCGPMTSRELAAIEQVRAPAISRVVTSLHRAEWISRQAACGDRRQFIIALTPAGSALLIAETSANTHWLYTRLAELTAAEQQILRQATEILDRLVRS
jgi:DNA-binding MarR family transcriptional regulator